MQCDWCNQDVPTAHVLLDDDGGVVTLCRECRADLMYCRAGGHIPQDPDEGGQG